MTAVGSPEVSQQYAAASLGQRFLGVIVDGLIFLSVTIGALAWAGNHGRGNDRTATADLIVFAIGFLYEVVLTTVWGQTLGKKAVGTRVVTSLGSLELPS